MFHISLSRLLFLKNIHVSSLASIDHSFNQTPDVHLNPDPNATCMIRCPFLRGLVFWCSWIYSSSYQMDEELVFP